MYFLIKLLIDVDLFSVWKNGGIIYELLLVVGREILIIFV